MNLFPPVLGLLNIHWGHQKKLQNNKIKTNYQDKYYNILEKKKKYIK